MKPTNFILILALVSLPLAEASFTDVRTYEWWIHQVTTGTGGWGPTSITVPATPHGHSVSSRTSIWEHSIAYHVSTSVTGTQTFAFLVDGVAITGCTWSMTRATLGLGVGVIHDDSQFFIRCLNATAVNPGTHTIQVTTAGTAIVSNVRHDLVLKQQDVVTDATLDQLATTVEVRARTAYTNTLVNETKQSVIDRTTYTNALINSSFIIHEAIDHAKHAYQNTRANETHAHIDAHFVYTNELINLTVGSALNLTVFELIQRIDANVSFIKTNLNNTFTMALGSGLDSSVNFTLLVIIAIIVLATWLYRKEEKNGIVYKAMGIIILLVAVLIALQLAGDWPPFGILAALIAFYGFGLAMHAFYQNKQNRKKSELEV